MIALTAILAAITLTLGLTPLGIIAIPGFIEVTLMCVPVIIGTLTLGLYPGVLLATVFALTSIIAAVTKSPLGAALMAANPAYTLIILIVPRLLIPVTTYAANRWLRLKKPGVKTAVCAAIGSLTNTAGFLALLALLFSDIVAKELFTFAAVINGTAEAAIAAAVCAPVVSAVRRAVPKLNGDNSKFAH